MIRNIASQNMGLYWTYVCYFLYMFYIVCIRFIHSVYDLRYFDILPNLSGWEEIAFPGASQFSVGSKSLTCKLNSPEPYLLYLAYIL